MAKTETAEDIWTRIVKVSDEMKINESDNRRWSAANRKRFHLIKQFMKVTGSTAEHTIELLGAWR